MSSLSELHKKPIADREYEALRQQILKAFQDKINTHEPGLVDGQASDYADYKRRSAIVKTWRDAYAEFDGILRQYTSGESFD